MDAIETLLALEAIKQLKARYFYTLDTKQWRDYGALFTADAVIDFSSQQALMQQVGTLGAVAADEVWRCVGGAALARGQAAAFRSAARRPRRDCVHDRLGA